MEPRWKGYRPQSPLPKIDLDLMLDGYLTGPEGQVKHVEGIETLGQDCLLHGLVLYWDYGLKAFDIAGLTGYRNGWVLLNPWLWLVPWRLRYVIAHELGHNVLQSPCEEKVIAWELQTYGALVQEPEVVQWPA